MIIISGTSKLNDTDGAREKMVAAVTAMVAATQAEEGCETVRYSWDLADDTTMIFHEVYADMGALQAHMGSAHMKAFYDAAGPLMGGRPDVTMWVNAEKGQMGPG